MEKNEDAFRTISEVADDLDLPQHVLRFWETRFAQIRPLKRAGGRRYYRPTDIGLLRTIRSLLYEQGYTIKGVQKLLKEQGARNLRSPAVEQDATDDPIDEPSLFQADDPISAALVEDDARRLTVLLPGDRRGLVDALVVIEECERILRTVLPPRAAG